MVSRLPFPAAGLRSGSVADAKIEDTSTARLPGPVMRWWTCVLCEDTMTEDWFPGAVERIADAGRQACLAIEMSVLALREGCTARIAGRSITDVVDELIAAGGRETRMSAADAFREYERAIASMRAGVVRELVDEGRLSLTDVAKRLKISRQAAARLYGPGPGPGPERSDEGHY